MRTHPYLVAHWLRAMFACSCLSIFAVSLSALEYVKQEPLSDKVDARASAWSGSSTRLKVPLIAWGGDIQTVLANGNAKDTKSGSYFAEQGLNVSLYREDIFSNQVEDYLKGETPFLRGTMGMLNMAADLTEKQSFTEMVVIYQLTWSAGGDALVVKEGINRPADLKGKTIALQAYGPHVDYLTTILSSVGLTTNDVTIRWLPDLFEAGPDSSSPAMALAQDAGVDAAMAIIPDALALTSGGSVGTGAEGSVRGAKILLSTKTADRVISDVYAVRRDFYQKYPEVVEKFVVALAKAEEELGRQVAANGSEFEATLRASASLLLDDANMVEDMRGMYADARFVGLGGNQRFFTNPHDPRRFEVLNTEIQKAFSGLGLASGTRSIAKAPFDYERLRRLSGASLDSEQQRFDEGAVAAVLSRRQQLDTLDEGELYAFEIYFRPNQNNFSADLYRGEFDKVIELASIYGGALLTIEGHSDPTSYLRSKKNGSQQMILNRIKQSAKNLSYSRANAVKDSLMAYGMGLGVTLDPSQFGVVGHGVMKPNTLGASYDSDGDISLASAPRTREEWEQTRRVVFRLIQVEAEADVFEPLF